MTFQQRQIQLSVIDHVPDDDQGLPVGLWVNAQSHQSFGLGTPDSADFIGRDDEPEGVLEVEWRPVVTVLDGLGFQVALGESADGNVVLEHLTVHRRLGDLVDDVVAVSVEVRLDAQVGRREETRITLRKNVFYL